MRALIFSAILLLITAECLAQRDLANEPKTSRYTYIYRITASEASALYQSDLNKMSEQYLHTLADSFLRKSFDEPVLPAGNYVFVYAEGNRLVTELRSAGDVRTSLLNNRHDLLVAVYNKDNEVISGASVRIGKKRVPWDDKLHLYRLPKYHKNGLIQVQYKEALFAFKTEKIRNYNKQKFLHKVAFTFPLKYISKPIAKLFPKKSGHRFPEFTRRTDHERKFRGFLVFSKPIYKPGDTLHLKAYIADQRSRPVERPLLLRLSDERLSIDTILKTIRSYGAGGYTADIVLNDSLDLDLDKEYTFTLEEPESRKYDLGNYDGDLDEDEYAGKRKVLMRGRFRLEEYELKSISFTARALKNEYTRGEEQTFFLKAVDENNLPVLDGRVHVSLVTNRYGILGSNEPYIFLADTIWQHDLVLDPVGETKLVIADSVLPRVSFSYSLHAQFLNSNNEMQQETIDIKYSDDPVKIQMDQDQDSLRISYLVSGRSKPMLAVLCGFDRNEDTLSAMQLMLPAVVAINPLASSYEAETDDAYETLDLKPVDRIVTAQAKRTKDSVRVMLVNPYHLKVWYTLFAKNRIVFRGYGAELDRTFKTHTDGNYSMSVQYVYSGKPVTDEFLIPWQDKLLTVAVEQPAYIFPGQQVNVDVTVTDPFGKAVADADITAWGITSKFTTFRTPYVPYMGKQHPVRKLFSGTRPDYELKKEWSIRYNWNRWSHEMGLDTMEYFRFLHPASLYIDHQPVPDSLTQFAPFVVLDGDIEPVHQLYLDERPVYFSQARQLQRYSFPVSPGKHSIRMRTASHMVTLDSFWIAKGVKTIVSINADTLNKRVRVTNMTDTLTQYEQTLWAKYMILVENNFRETPATIRGNALIWLNPELQNTSGDILAGPFPDRYAELVVRNEYGLDVETEGSYLYHFEKGLIKQKQLPFPRFFSQRLNATASVPGFADLVLTQEQLDSLWEDYLDHRSVNTNLFNPYAYNSGRGRFSETGELRFQFKNEYAKDAPLMKNVLLFRYDDPDFLKVFPGRTRDMGSQEQGMYRAMFLLYKNRYFILDSIRVKPDGFNLYKPDSVTIQEPDSVSIKIWKTISSRTSNYRMSEAPDLSEIKENFNEKYLAISLFNEAVTGKVSDDKGNPLAGVAVWVKGTRVGTVTNLKGEYSLKAPASAILVFSGVGFEPDELSLRNAVSHDVVLRMSTKYMQEVVVTAFGVSKKRELTGSVTTVNGMDLALSGKVAGVNIRSEDAAFLADTSRITLRGIRSLSADSKILIVIDGVPVSGAALAGFDPNDFESVTVLKGGEATAMYGQDAGNGVIVVNTKHGRSNAVFQSDSSLAGASGLRTHFRDDAFWLPKLKTDAAGKVNFKVKYPDDITSWRNMFIAMAGKRGSGYFSNTVKAFKSMTGALSGPSFAIEGDRIDLIGKATNYSIDSMVVRRSFYFNDSLQREGMIGFRHAWIDTMAITVKGTDSLKMKYIVEKENGFMDGEERKIPVFAQGVLETDGMFATLSKDTSFNVAMNSSGEKVKVYAESSVLPVLLQETERIRNYEYLCNEQLASKLKALLMEKRISAYLKRKFEGEKNISEILSKLSKSRAGSGLWGWWSNSEPVMWISLHVIDALLEADEAGYKSYMNRQVLTDYLVYQLESIRGRDRIEYIQLLFRLGAKADYKKYIDSLDTYKGLRSFYDNLAIVELKQKAGMPVALDTLLAKQKHTMFGNVYWGEDCYRFFDNSIQNTLRMYRIIRNNNAADPLLGKARNYFLEQRRTGSWRNTYEASLIMETLLPDLMKLDSTAGPATLQFSGSRDITVQQFPFAMELKPGEAFSVAKKGATPVYFTAYHQYWNPAPDTASNGFMVRTHFEKNGQTITQLKGGEAVTLQTEVTVDADAAYVMVEIPIPAGCSYNDKSQSWYNNEVHREYFKNKVSIFCSELKQGKYKFSISLMPRYSGVYKLNPGKAEMMYFPVFYGRETMKEVEVK